MVSSLGASSLVAVIDSGSDVMSDEDFQIQNEPLRFAVVRGMNDGSASRADVPAILTVPMLEQQPSQYAPAGSVMS
jgi:hypothetical protein